MTRCLLVFLAGLALALAPAACGGGNGTGNEDAAPDTFLDATEMADGAADALDTVETADEADEAEQPPPYVSARKVESEADLIGGPNAYGVAGKAYVMENSRVRFLLQDVGMSVHLSLQGGNIIDADLQRGKGVPGRDLFREMVPMIGLRVSSMDALEIVNDGKDGSAAVIRVTGKDVSAGILPEFEFLAFPLNANIVTEYILEPDVPWLRLRTELENLNDAPLAALMVGDLLTFGGPESFFTQEGGFTGTPTETTAIMSWGRDVSYGVTVKKGTLQLPMLDASGTAGMVDLDFSVPAHGKQAFERYFIVGDGSVDSVLREVHKLRGETTLTVGGKLLGPDGLQLGSDDVPLTVTAFPAGQGSRGEENHALNQASTLDGTWSMELVPGSYDLIAWAPGRVTVAKKNVTVGTQPLAVDFTFGPQGMVKLDVQEVDAGGVSQGTIPAKVSLACTGDTEPPWEELGEDEDATKGQCSVFFSRTGSETFPVRPGTYKAVVSRGLEYEIAVTEPFVVGPGTTSPLPASLWRSLDTFGWMSADLHEHSVGSIDGHLLHTEKVLENLGEGVEIAGCTEHDNMESHQPAIEELGAHNLAFSADGDEVSVNAVAHFNIFSPQGTFDELYPYIGAKLFADRTIPELFDVFRSIPGIKVVQLNHPRSNGSGYLFYVRFDPISGMALAENASMEWAFDAMEVKSDIAVPAYFLPDQDAGIKETAGSASADQVSPMKDWFALMNLGYSVCATGNSDSHGHNHDVGYQRNFLRVGKEDPAQLAAGDYLQAVLDERCVVSNGPFIQVWSGSDEVMGHMELVDAPDGEAVLHVMVSAATWIDVSSLEVYANGRPLVLEAMGDDLAQVAGPMDADALSWPIASPGDEVIRLDADIHLFPDQDTWYVFLVRGEGSLSPVGSGAPFAYTNAVYVDVDGDGFDAPGVGG